ncbi:MAG: calcium-translocating P-type ATPase, PMCA-type [Candidatus Hodarchaeota archaeon]
MTEWDQPLQELPWHGIAYEEVLQHFKTNRNGLTDVEAKRRLEIYGPNQLREGKQIHPLELLLEQFKNYLIIILLFAAFISGIVAIWDKTLDELLESPEELLDPIVILIIVLFAAILGFAQEYRAERAIEALREMTAPTASVIRAGRTHEIASVELVPGDIIPISAGDKIPADMRLIESVNLQTDEAALTGESVPINKDASRSISQDAPLGDRKTMVYTGTVATYGRGISVVVSTGMKTEFGKIAGLLEEVEAGETPLQRNLDQLGKTLAKVSFAVIFIVFAVGVIQEHEILEMFIWAIALAIAVVPEALPAVITISLAIGVQRMSQRNALIRKLPAVETLGATSIICSDKTGTLTKAEMTVRAVHIGNRFVDLTECDLSDIPRENEDCHYLLLSSALCNDAKWEEDPRKKGKLLGNPTEAALKAFAYHLGYTDDYLARYPRIDEIPFTSERKMMTTVNRSKNGLLVFTKGAPEILLTKCSLYFDNGEAKPLNSQKISELKQITENMARNALRTIAVAYKKVEDSYDKEKLEENLVFLGFLGMIDPPRENVAAAVAQCRNAGIKPVMITGDHMITALAIAKELGIAKDGSAITGTELDSLSDKKLVETIDDIEVFARVSPAHKLRVVEAYSKKGHVVAMTGDGINDAPALKRADVGIAMGIKGTDVTKEAADMILADDNFVSIVGAVEEGRIMYANIKKYLMYLLSANLGEILLLGLAVLLGMDLPLVAIQILYINLATDGLPALALSIDPPEGDFMKQAPRDPHESVFTKPVVKLMILGGIWSATINLSLFILLHAIGDMSLIHAQCMVFTTLIFIEFLKAFSFRSDHQSMFSYGPFTNKWLNYAIGWETILLLLLIYVPFLQGPFRTFSLGPVEWIIAIGCAITIIPVLEFGKWFFVRRIQTLSPFSLSVDV